jgi:succinate dehydrogenase / fumarate reductase cytochrome b subunit
MALSPSTVHTARPARVLVWQRFSGLLGVGMLGSFTVAHLAGLLPMLTGGADAFNATLAVRRSWPVLVFTALWAGVPLLLHAAHGVWRLKTLRSNVGRFPTRTAWSNTLQRWMGPLILVFVAFHVWTLRVVPAFQGKAVDAAYVSRHLSAMTTLDLYVLGALAVAFHLAAGVWKFLIRWGVVDGTVAQRRLAWICVGWGVLLAGWTVATAAAFHDGKFVLP